MIKSARSRDDVAGATRSSQRVLQPASWPRPRGYANGVAAAGETIVLAGQIGWDVHGRLANGMVAQTAQALANIVTLLAEAGAAPHHLVRLTWFVTDLNAYRSNLAAIGSTYRAAIGRHFPAMSVIGVAGLVEPGAVVEIEATAVLPKEQITGT